MMKKRWTAAALLVCLFLNLAGFAPAALADSIAVYVASNTLKVYQKASTSAKVLGVMAFGEKMTCTAVSGDWARVKNSDGDTGYCKKSGLTTENPNTMDEEVYINKTGVKVYKKPSTSADVMLKTSEENIDNSYTAVAVTGDGDWVRLKNGKYYGYVKEKYVSPVSEREAEDAPVQMNLKVYVVKTTLKVYKKASSGSAQLGVVSYGEKLTLLAIEDEWAKVENSAGSVGYCKFSGLSEDNPNGASIAARATKDKHRVYKSADDDSDTIAKLSEGDSVDVLALFADGDWARVELQDGSVGYVLAKYLALEQLSGEEENKEEQAPEEDDEEEAEGVTGYIAAGIAKVYAGADTSSDLLGRLCFGQSVIVLQISDGWAKVRNSSGDVGYCLYSALTDEDPNTLDTVIYAGSDGAKVYAQPDTDANIISTLEKNESLTLVAVMDGSDWGRVRLSGGGYGYVLSGRVTTSPGKEESGEAGDEPENNNAELAGSTAAAVVALAKQQLGDPYVYGATGPDKFDCSGLVYYCFKNAAGITLKRTAYSQGYDSSYKKITDIDDLQIGDLVFFNTNSSDSDLCDHSGIYIGGGKAIHASSAAAKVITSDLTSGYYQRTFSWGRRVL